MLLYTLFNAFFYVDVWGGFPSVEYVDSPGLPPPEGRASGVKRTLDTGPSLEMGI